MGVIDAWMQKLAADLAAEDMKPLAERMTKWLGRGDVTVLLYLILREVQALRAAVESQGCAPKAEVKGHAAREKVSLVGALARMRSESSGRTTPCR